MGKKWGSCDFNQLKDLQKKLEKLQGKDFESFCEEVAKELAARLLAKVIRRTPVGKYPEVPGKVGGTLRRGWTGGKPASAKSFVDDLKVRKTGDVYTIEITNPVKYASYVEFGHRTRNHKGWVPGRFMMTISENELNAQAPKLLERKLKKYLEGVFNGK